MSEYNLGTAKGTIEIDYKGTGVDQANEALKGTSKHASSADEALNKTARGAAVAGLGIAAGLGVALKSAADFEKGLSGIQAVSGATTGEMDQVRKKALQLGADTAFSASEASGAMEELVKAGIPIPDVLNGAADATVALAAAGGVDLPQAATIAANAMNQFGLSADQLPAIVDRIAGAANTSAIDVSDLGQSMAQAGAVANLSGLSFDDTALAIAAMGNAGIKGSDAGTSLKSMLQNLQPVTDKQIGLMKDLGLVTKDGANQFYDAKGKIKSMAQIGGVLEKALAGMSDAQKTQTLETLFGSDAIRAAAIVADTGAAGFKKMNDEMNKTKAADVAKVRMQNLSGQVEQLKGSAETLAIGLGSVLIPMFNKIVGYLTQVVNWFSNLDKGTQTTIVTVAAIAAGVLLFVSALIKFVQFAQAAKAAMIALNATFLTNPIFLIIMAIIALVAGIVLLYKKNEAFRNFINGAWAAIKGAISAVVTWITGTAVPWIVNAWNTIVSGAQSLWASLVSIFNAVKGFISGVFNGIVSVVTTVWSFIVGLITGYFNMIRTIITTVLNVIMQIWRGTWNLFGPLIMAVWDLIKAIIQVALAWIGVAISTALNFVKGVWTTGWNAIKSVVTTVFNAVNSVILAVWGKIKSAFMSALNYVKGILVGAFNFYKGIVTSVMNAIRSVISSIWGAIGGRVMSVVNTIKSTISSGFNAAKAIVSSVFESIRSSISSKLDAAKALVSGAISSIKGFFSGAGSWLMDAGRRIIQGLIDGITGMVGKVSGAISGIADKIRGFLPGSPIKEGPLREHGWNQGRPGKKLVASLADGIESDIGLLSRAFEGINPTITPSLTAKVPAGVGGAFSAAPAPAPVVPTPNVYHFDISIDPKDLDGVRSAQDFVERIEMLVPMMQGVNG